MTIEVLSVLETLETDDVRRYFEGYWRKLAACTGIPTKEFYPASEKEQRKLHRICEQCVVRPECLDYALMANEDHGYWGDRSERARRKLRRNLRKSRPDLIKAGRENAARTRKSMKGKISKTLAGVNEEFEEIDEGEFMEHLLPKVRQLLHSLAKQQGVVNAEQFLLSFNISPEAFAQRLNLARQMKWVSVDGVNLKLTRKGRDLLDDSGISVEIRIQPKQPTTPQEVSMSSNEHDWLSDLDIEILTCLASGDIEDGANASGVLAEKIGAETGSSFSNRLKRLADEGLIRRRVNGKRTNYLAITDTGNRVLNGRGNPVSSSSNGSKPNTATGSVPTSDEVEEWSGEFEEQLLGQLESTRQMIDTVHTVLAENARLRERFTNMVAERDDAVAALAECEEEIGAQRKELERLRPLAERYTQMQQLLVAPAE